MAILASRLDTIARKMANTLFRTARSGVLNSGHDFSCVHPDRRRPPADRGREPADPRHDRARPDVPARSRRYHPELRRGDAFLHNSPYHGNSHPADQCLIVPVIDDGGRPPLLGAVQGAPGRLRQLGADHLRRPRPRRLRGGRADLPGRRGSSATTSDIGDIIRMCLTRIRVPGAVVGRLSGRARRGADRRARAAGARPRRSAGTRSTQHAEDWFDYSEARMIAGDPPAAERPRGRAHLPRPVPGRARGHPARDRGRGRRRGRPDRGRPARQPGLPAVRAQPERGLRAQHRDDRRLQRHRRPYRAAQCRQLPPGRGAGSARTASSAGRAIPHSCSVATTNLADRVSSPVQRAIAEIADGFGMAEGGADLPAGRRRDLGHATRAATSAPFVNQVHLGLTGGAGAPAADGWLTIVHVGNAGICRHDCIEVDELHHPIRILERRLVQDSEGAGRFRGAPGGAGRARPDRGLRDAHLLHRRRHDQPGPGRPRRPAGRPHPGLQAGAARTRSCRSRPAPGVALAPGETIVSVSAGGGGYGRPTERDPSGSPTTSPRAGSAASARPQVYGVVLDDRGHGRRRRDRRRRAALAQPG